MYQETIHRDVQVSCPKCKKYDFVSPPYVIAVKHDGEEVYISLICPNCAMMILLIVTLKKD